MGEEPHEGGEEVRGMGSVGTVLGAVVIEGRVVEVRTARRFVAGAAAELFGADHEYVYTAELLASEVVTNAVLHSDSGAVGGTLTVVVLGVDGGLRVEVVDDGADTSPRRRGHDPAAEDGRGLCLVEELADDCGGYVDAAGTTVWFTLGTTHRNADAAHRSGGAT